MGSGAAAPHFRVLIARPPDDNDGMEVEIRITFTDTCPDQGVKYSKVIIDALRKWRPPAKDFLVRIAGEEVGINVVSEA